MTKLSTVIFIGPSGCIQERKGGS